MNSEEYERRKRLLDEQLRADLELIRAGHEARLRALDALRDGSGGETLASAETQTAETQTGAAPAGSAAWHSSVHDILNVFPQLPEVFDKADVVRILGYVPHRATLNRAWSHLRQAGKIAMAQHSDGPRPTVYRKLPQGE
ncbi:MAG TPA: hypothetical protein VIJ61_17820 [Thermoanaerobaculia bacterium]